MATGAAPHQRFTPVSDRSELLPYRVDRSVLRGRRQARVGQGFPCDRFGILGDGLGPTTPAAAFGGTIGLDFTHVITRSYQRQHQWATQERRTLHTDTIDAHLAVGLTPIGWSMWTSSQDPANPTVEEMISRENQLHQYDDHVSRPRHDKIDVTVHAPAYMDIWDAGRKLSDAVAHVVGAQPVGVEVITEDELYRRADDT